MKHRPGEKEQCQVLETIKMVTGVCVHSWWLAAIGPWNTSHSSKGLGWGGRWMGGGCGGVGIEDCMLLKLAPWRIPPPRPVGQRFSRNN